MQPLAPACYPYQKNRSATMKRSARVVRCYTEQVLDENNTVELDKRSSHHLSTVLRARAGQSVCLFNGNGFDYVGNVVDTGRKTRVEISQKNRNSNESPLRIQLVQAIARGDKMDSVIQKSTELGVSAIQPLYTRHSIAKLDESRSARKLEHWQSVIISACEQSGRAVVPSIQLPVTLDQFIASQQSVPTTLNNDGAKIPASIDADAETDFSNGLKLILAPNAGDSKTLTSVDSCVSILIGPESGFDDDEIESACRAGYQATQLGPRIMRTETAGPAALAILQAQFGDITC